MTVPTSSLPERKSPTAIVLAIGTELTQGQIINRNAAWISERLTDAGFQIDWHFTVADDRAKIREALDLGSAAADLLVVTGGLGPTTDDFTREVISEWIAEPLEFREVSWLKIIARLSSFGVEIAESNRSQCFFPPRAIVLENSEGTADAFRFSVPGSGERSTSEVLVLPGPPTEGKHIWDRHVSPWMKSYFPVAVKETLESWKCLGKSEAILGEIVEKAVSGFNVKTGYRASAPYVEVKIWIPMDYPREQKLALLAKVNAELAPCSVSRNEEDLGVIFFSEIMRKIPEGAITFIDAIGDGTLTHRLFELFRTKSGEGIRVRSELLTRMEASGSAAELPDSANEWIFALFKGGEVAVLGPAGKFVRELPCPYSTNANPAVAERLRRYHSEIALKAFAEVLRTAESRDREKS